MTGAVQEAVIASCSFCGKPNTEVERLVAGPGVYICNECVALSQQVMDETTTRSVPQLAPWQQIDRVGAARETRPGIARGGAVVEEPRGGGVRGARELGATGAGMGEALGMPRQSAWARFSGEE